MKCPPLVSRSWLPQPQTTDSEDDPPPRHLAKVILSIDPRDDENSSPQFTMELATNDSGNAPKCYSLDMSKDFIPMCVFSQTNEGKATVEGKVLNKFDMKPHTENIEDYGKLCRERTNKYMVKSRQVKVIENDRGEHMIPKPAMLSSIASSSKDKNKAVPTKGSDSRRSRRDRGEMEAIMFKLFERQPNWTLRQLIQETDQPEQFLKDILKELCVYNNRGTNQGSYELKPEYKQGSIKEASPKSEIY
ncbi:Transcription initiation factor IIF [Macleaya cordata]|uniref:Transcription initiation factor IIF n=1 Tax=Macleaya cordata TaxID=56857 RepID=A0A200R607_MACCD|nr:Transcription initiation factor IIF [Macleaya cordata]